MKKTLLFTLTALIAVACSNGPVAKINATIEGAADSSVVLQKLNFNKLEVVDTVKTDASGSFGYKVTLTGSIPAFYYINCGGRNVASVVLLPGDKVNVDVKAKGGYSVEGSEESQMLQKVNDSFSQAAVAMDKILNTMPENPSESQVKEINHQLSKIYVDYKQTALRHVVTYPNSITSAVVLFQKFNDDLKVFDEPSDAIIFKRVLDSLSTIYPSSDLVLALRDEVDSRQNTLSMINRLNEAEQASFPDLFLPDINGQKRKLSDFDGKVIILSFWSVAQTEYKMFNNELLAIYEKYHDKGLEIYQVGLDVDKPAWASVVKSQKLPFVNVNDGYGIESAAVASYNLKQIPAMFVIDRNGNMAGKDVFDEVKLEALVKGLL